MKAIPAKGLKIQAYEERVKSRKRMGVTLMTSTQQRLKTQTQKELKRKKQTP